MRNFDVDLNTIPLLLGPLVVPPAQAPPAEAQPLTPHEKFALLAGQKIPGWATTYNDILNWHEVVFEGEMNRRRSKKILETAEQLREEWHKRMCSGAVAIWTQETARAALMVMYTNDRKCGPMLVRTLLEFGALKLTDVPNHKLPEFMELVQKNLKACLIGCAGAG